MRVEIKILKDIDEAYAVIYTDAITEEIQAIVSAMELANPVITAKAKGRIRVLQPKEIMIVRTEGEKTMIHTRAEAYVSPKRLYELEAQLGKGFMRISKSAIVNLREIESVESSFNGVMMLVLKNGCKDYISRKYLPDFKRYLGL